MDALPHDPDFQTWKQAYRSLQAPKSHDCLSDDQFIALVLDEIQGANRTCLADHIVQCQLCTDAYLLLRRVPPLGP